MPLHDRLANVRVVKKSAVDSHVVVVDVGDVQPGWRTRIEMPRSCERRHLPDFRVVEALPCFAASSFAEDENKEERGDKGDTGKEGKGSSCLEITNKEEEELVRSNKDEVT